MLAGGFVMANEVKKTHGCSMKVAEVVRLDAGERCISEEESLKQGLEPQSRAFVEGTVEALCECPIS